MTTKEHVDAMLASIFHEHWHSIYPMAVMDRLILYSLIRGLRPQSVLEIGVHYGNGARIIAAALEDEGGDGKAVGIDPRPDQFISQNLYERYQIIQGYSPLAVPEAIRMLGGSVDFVFIDAIHKYDHVTVDVKSVLPYLQKGGHILFHDSYHHGVTKAIDDIVASNPDIVDCGFLTRYPTIVENPVGYNGMRLIRVGTLSSQQMLTDAYKREGRPAPSFAPEYLNWDR